uniref:Putative Guanosine-3',5'-bis(Diphosphate) 3'-diphosphatase n=1 Tax=Magnetococcus massalia (strain MO-1) TaxID=451514 RepID=A0A1S7LCC6_MAGMO|nr:putative Guanosine-3',5'-bis(Diphosphate) 3'-diphosphatase [Candidatus Magnetococcus massalia]
MGEESGKKVAKAAELAVYFHEGQFRKLDGTPYVTHCFSVATHCLSWGLHDTAGICAALLHDSIEDAQEKDPETIIGELDPEVLSIVQALSKIRNLQTGSGDMPATYRRILSAASRDLRVLVIKTFDVMHNSETLDVHGPEKAKVKASLGLIYVGIARRLGMMVLADALIDRLLPHLMPVQYQRATRSLNKLQNQGASLIDRLVQEAHRINEDGLIQDLTLEPRKIADFFMLAEKPGTGRLNRVGWPVYRIKFMVADELAAWRLLGRIHNHFEPLPRHIRDYMNAPRINGYRALTTRILWEGVPINVHVIQSGDDEANRYGILAQWGDKPLPFTSRYMSLLGTLGDSDLRMSEVHAHVLPDHLDAYSPRGERFTFPADSTVIDFAYAVHTEIGNRCIGARINGIKRAPEYPFKDGDVIDIITAKTARPSRSWLNVVKTARAKTLIKIALKNRQVAVQGVLHPVAGHFTLTQLASDDISWSNCCCPAPGDPVVGRLSADGRWIVHRQCCHKLQEPQGDNQWEHGSWDLADICDEAYLSVTLVIERDGETLQRIFDLLGQHEVRIHLVESKPRSATRLLHRMVIDHPELERLGVIFASLRELPGIYSLQDYSWQSKTG